MLVEVVSPLTVNVWQHIGIASGHMTSAVTS